MRLVSLLLPPLALTHTHAHGKIHYHHPLMKGQTQVYLYARGINIGHQYKKSMYVKDIEILYTYIKEKLLVYSNTFNLFHVFTVLPHKAPYNNKNKTRSLN